MSILNLAPVLKTRRNHALEHATLTVLSQKYPRVRFAGHSNPTGFIVFGNVPIEAVADSAAQALKRLQNGEHELAVHPGCGTNHVISGLVGGTLAWIAMSGTRGRRERLRRLPLMVVLSVIGFFLAQPLGLLAQAHITTLGDPGAMKLVEVRQFRIGRVSGFRVQTRDGE
ncbi:MAG: hypothetical protein JXA13_04380 [Anaerolineales bacterium]|nr:hypothetical protein [Anaerolineales bacterium]